MFPQLPTELKISILQHTDKRSLPAVLRASSTFRDIAEPILYSHVALAPFVRQGAFAGASIACFRGLVARPTAAAAVRRLTLNFHQDYMRNIDFTVTRRVIEAFREALPGLLNVEKFIIAHWNDRLPGLHLPPNLPFRSLQHYRGPPELLQDVQSRDLVNLRVYTSRPNFELISQALLAAARYNDGKLRALELDRSADDSDEIWLEFIPKIHSLFPNVRFLGLGRWRNDQVDGIVKSMAKFQDIRLFSMLDTWDDWRHGRQRLVGRLCTGCPRLRAIRLGNEEWRFSEILDGWITTGYGLESPESARIWKEADYRKYLVDPENEGFVYNSLDF